MQAKTLPLGSAESLALEWQARVLAAEPLHIAGDLYCGRGYSEARIAAGLANAPLYILSAGHGFVSSTAKIPAYDLTLSAAAENCILRRTHPRATASDWWRALQDAKAEPLTLSRLLFAVPTDIVLMALPSAYLSMIWDDIMWMPAGERQRLRIFGSGQGERQRDPALSDILIPYDDRLDGPDSPLPGTGADFAQRALRHFVETILPTVGLDGDHQRAVAESLSEWRRPEQPPRTGASDRRIEDLIDENWNNVDGRSGKMLRLLRDELQISCEQSRFARLFHIVKARRAL